MSKIKPKPKIIFSPKYDIQFFGLEKLHLFDSCKYGRAWKKLKNKFGEKLDNWTKCPETEVSIDELSTVHTKAYLSELITNSQYLSRALEIPPLALVPNKLIDKKVLYPMRLATRGTIMAAECALEDGISVNLSGGYHHASREQGDGFCIYSDIGVAIYQLKQSGKLKSDDKVIVIDLDAHQGNGIARIFYEDRSVVIFDMYNADIYPLDMWARKRIDANIPLSQGTDDSVYIDKLERELPSFIENQRDAKIAFFNAGTDIYERDPLGKLSISKQGVLKRDKFVLNSLINLDIPCAMVLGGGYTKESYELVADSIYDILNTAYNYQD
ncbi:histone deacetylase family protein [Calothrix sp. NIES-2100]|uniref:histone deacetylase family protein n=1 Tax=Calothrix sp. NIES-2100 TaxID=1954172 RepID=UPI0030DA5EFC